MAVNKRSRDLLALLSIVLAFGIVVFLNLVAEKRFYRVDLTEDRIYSLSDSFKNILARLEQTPDRPLKVTYYSSENGPSKFLQVRRDVLDKLKEVETAGRGLVRFEVVDPTTDNATREELVSRGAFLDLGDRSQDKRTVERIFSAVRLVYRDKEAMWISWLSNPEMIEYELGSCILKLTQQEQPIVAISLPKSDEMQLPNRPPPPCGYEDIVTQLQKLNLFDLRPVEWNAPLPAKTALLVLFAPRDLSERARYEITKYLASGGRVLLLQSSIKVQSDLGRSFQHAKAGLEEYFAGLGLAWGQDFVCDTFNLGSLFQGYGPTRPALPTFVVINGENVSQDSPITRYMSNLVLPFPTALKVDKEQAGKAGIEVETLATTSAQSWSEPFNEHFKADEIDHQSRSKFEDPKAVFVKMTGRFPFPWDGKAPPPFNEKDRAGEKPVEVDSKPGVLLVWSCPDSLHNNFLRNENLGQAFLFNKYLFVNIVEYASLGEDLIRIRTKNYGSRAILRLENDNATRNLVKAFLIAFMPIVVGCFALGFWFLRRSAQVRYERRFAQTTGPSSFSA